MTEDPSEPEVARQRAPSIVDLVFAGEPSSGGRRVAVASGLVVALYGGVFVLVGVVGHRAGDWSAELATRVHDAVARERAADLAPPAAPPAPAPAAAMVPSLAPHARSARRARAAPPAPAQAARLAASAPAPADFTGTAFVVGANAAYAGGTTVNTGTSRAPVSGEATPGGTGTGASGHARARPVSLDGAAWSCPWPAEADAQLVNEQTVVLRAAVRADGRAERVDVLADPGFGFGLAARLCALATRFEPARDPAGQPIAALSPPIRVHFLR